MSKNSKALDGIMRAKKGPRVALAAAIRATVPKSMLHAHRNGAVPTLPRSMFYETVAGLSGDDWLSGADMRRTQKRIERAVAMLAGREEP